MERNYKVDWIYFIFINLFSGILCWYDKELSKKNRYRISEKTFFLVSCCGGAIGLWLSMYLFHHKTRKWYFVCFIPLFALITLLIFW